ncbi:MAG TPA: hypothetical protein VKV77_04815 [Methylovirgula sp.]|nr:hypothetical protein [Methylovirgula sp.]
MSKAVAWRSRGDEPARHLGLEPRFHEAPTFHAGQLNRMESMLNALLAAIGPGDAPLPPTRAPNVKAHPSLATAIAEISQRQRALEDRKPAVSKPEVQEPAAQTASLVSLQADLAALGAKLDEMRHEQSARSAQPVCNLDKLRAEIADMSQALRDLGSRGSIATLEQAIRGLTQKIEVSRTEGIREAVLSPIEELLGELRRSLAEIDPRTTIKGLESELHRLGSKLDDLARAGLDPAAFETIQQQTREIRDLLTAAAARPLPVEQIERQVAQLAESIDRQRAAGREPSYALDEDRATAFGKIEDRLDAISAKVEQAIAESRDQTRYEALARRIDTVHDALTNRESAPDTRPLEDLVRGLAEKLERAQEPKTEPQAIEALERQIAELAQRLDRSGFSTLSALEETIASLFAELERTRQTALEAAQNAVRHALSQPGGANSDVSRELQRLRAVQDETDRRTLSTLNAVHETLEKVVDRLAVVEGELAQRPGQRGEALASGPVPVFAPPQREAPRAPQVPADDRTRRDRAMPPAAALEDFLIEPGSGFPGRREAGQAQDEPAPTRANFIAAARRAAQAAQKETAAAVAQNGARNPLPTKPDHASFIQQTRNFIAQHKRPVVLSLAALFVAIGAYAVIKSLGHGQASLSYNADTPAAVAPVALSAPAPSISQAMTPVTVHPQLPRPAQMASAAPPPAAQTTQQQSAAPTPANVDLTPTGSIGKSKNAASAEHAVTEAELETAAQSGNAKAQFMLATDYTEGRHVTRDLAAAAQWYAKAAAQGLAPAQYRLASFYEKGLGVPRDLAQARAWYRKAAERGNIRAMHNLAVLAAGGGDSGRPDYATAAQWFKKAADYGVRDSQYNLAVLLARGLGVPQNLVSSYAWFAIVAAQGDDDAAKKRDDVGARLDPNQLAAAKAQAGAFRPRTPDAEANEVQLPATGWNIAPAPVSSGKPQRAKMSML